MLNYELGKESSLKDPFLDRVILENMFEKYNSNEDHSIYFIYGVHWAALTPTQYSDDSKHYDVSNFDEYKKILQNMVPIIPNAGKIDNSGEMTKPEMFKYIDGSKSSTDDTSGSNEISHNNVSLGQPAKERI